jgi:hypothetical protein
MYLDQVAPEVFAVSEACTCACEAAKISLREQRRNLRAARSAVTKLQSIRELQQFYISSMKKLAEIEKDTAHTEEVFRRCLDYFCVEWDVMDTNEFFGILSQFFASFDSAVASHETRERMAFAPQQRHGRFTNVGQYRTTTSSSTTTNSSLQPINKTRLSIFGRSSNNSDTPLKKMSTAMVQRASIFGRIKPSNSLGTKRLLQLQS